MPREDKFCKRSALMTSQDNRSLRITFIIFCIVSLISIWLHRYPAGIDLPQHANVFAIWAKLLDPEEGYTFFYRLHAFTPYLLTYAFAYPFTLLFGALAATKIVLSVIALATPYLLMRWLRYVGGEVWWCFWGFLLVFGFSYFWGFISFSMSFPLLFIYLIQVERLRDVTCKSLIATSVISVLLFFCHAITFGVASLIGGLRSFRKGDRSFIIRGLHLLPSTILLLIWFQNRQKDGQVLYAEWPPNPFRILTFFSGVFSANSSYLTVIIGLLLVILMVIMARPQFTNKAARFLPLLIGSLGFLFLPETMASTWLVGTRFVVFVHAFIPVAFTPTVTGRKLTYMRWTTVSIVMACLLALNIRLFGFNRELVGMDKVSSSMPLGSDVHGLLVDTGWHSQWVGDLQMGQVMAWVTAERGGILENDQARYFPIPIQRRIDYPWQSHYRFLLARGPTEKALSIASRFEPEPKVVQRAGDWILIESSALPLSSGDLDAIRYGQQWGDLRSNLSVNGEPLSVAGQRYATGFGSCPKSIIQVRPKKQGRFLEGKVGINDNESSIGYAIFKILDGKKQVLFESGVMSTGMSAKEFKVPLKGEFLFLVAEAGPGMGINNAYANWLDLSVK